MELLGSATKGLARLGLHRVGLIHALSWYNRRSFQILTYHRFGDLKECSATEVLTRHCMYIRKHFNPVSMSQIARSLHAGESLPPNALAITIDDGYRDFLSVAFPVLQAYEIPVTVYLIADFMDGKIWPWWNQVTYAARHTTKPYVDVCLSAERSNQRLPTQTDEERETSSSRICDGLAEVPDRARLLFLSRLAEVFQVDIPTSVPVEDAPLTWDDARELEKAGVEFGAHSKTHPVLSTLDDEELICLEVAESKCRIENELRSPVIHFCYPCGGFNDSVVAAVKACGFLTAVTVVSGYNNRLEHPHLLKRRSADLISPDYYFREVLAGLH